MSLLSVLRSGVEKFTYAANKLQENANAIYKTLPVAFHPAIDAALSIAKQGASDAIASADKAEGPVITAAATALQGAFRTAATAYLGPVIGGALTGPVSDGIDRIRDQLIAEIHTEALYLKAKLAAPVAPAKV
jgi:hypothetical protein